MKKYVVREYYADDPTPDKYYCDTREECDTLVKELYDTDDDIDEIIISDVPEEVDAIYKPKIYCMTIYRYNEETEQRHHTNLKECLELLFVYMDDWR